MVYGLKKPFHFSGLGVKRDDTVTKQIHACPVTTVEIGGRRSRAEIHGAPFLVHRKTPPVIIRSDLLVSVPWPGIVSRIARKGDRMEDPFQLAGDDIEPAH